MYGYVNAAPLFYQDRLGLAPGPSNAKPGGNSHDRRQWDRHAPKKPDDPNARTKQDGESADGFVDTVKCYFGFRACDAEEELAKTRKCVKYLCKTTCPENEFIIDIESGLHHAYNPGTTKCKCIKWGWNKEYDAGPLPGLKAPGK
jgi:hypothetical protein